MQSNAGSCQHKIINHAVEWRSRRQDGQPPEGHEPLVPTAFPRLRCLDLRACCSFHYHTSLGLCNTISNAWTHWGSLLADAATGNGELVDDVRERWMRHDAPPGTLDPLNPGCCTMQQAHVQLHGGLSRAMAASWAVASTALTSRIRIRNRIMLLGSGPAAASRSGPGIIRIRIGIRIMDCTTIPPGAMIWQGGHKTWGAQMCSPCIITNVSSRFGIIAFCLQLLSHGPQAAPCPTSTATAAPQSIMHPANMIYGSIDMYTYKWTTCLAGSRTQSASLEAARPGLPWRRQTKGFHHTQVPAWACLAAALRRD